MTSDNAEKSSPDRKQIGRWLRRHREDRAWSHAEMARRLIRAARADNDMSLPDVRNLVPRIHRWERGVNCPSERYRIYYCRAFRIVPADFGAAGARDVVTYTVHLTAADVRALIAELRELVREATGGSNGHRS